MIYGLSNDSAAYLRAFENGKLNSTCRHGQQWLPDTSNSSNDCPTYTDAPICYQSGKCKNIDKVISCTDSAVT